MEFLIDFLMELLPDAFTEFLSEKCFGFIRERVENTLLRGLLCGLVVAILAVLGVALAFGVCALLVFLTG